MQTVYLKHHLFINQLDSTEDTASNKARHVRLSHNCSKTKTGSCWFKGGPPLAFLLRQYGMWEWSLLCSPGQSCSSPCLLMVHFPCSKNTFNSVMQESSNVLKL